MNNPILKIGIIAGAAWFLFRDQLAAMFGSSSAAAAAPSTSSTTPAAPAYPAGTTAQSAQTTKDKLLAWAQRNAFYIQQGQMLNAHQWNYGYREIRGTDPGDPGLMFADPNRNMTLEEYWTGITARGLSGAPASPQPWPVAFPRSRAAKAWRY